MKSLIIKILFFLLRKEYYRPLSKQEVDTLLTKLALTDGLERLPAYLQQCSDTAKNQYLYNQDEMLKGTIFAFISLREQILQKIPKTKKKLTPEEEIGIMKKRGY
jgi:hypothetical protein